MPSKTTVAERAGKADAVAVIRVLGARYLVS
jgi:hypothetical protein